MATPPKTISFCIPRKYVYNTHHTHVTTLMLPLLLLLLLLCGTVHAQSFPTANLPDWNLQLGSNNGEDDRFSGTCLDDSHEYVYFVGYTYGIVGEQNFGSADVVLSKISTATGNVSWTRQIGSAGSEVVYEIRYRSGGEVSSDARMYIAGYTSGKMDSRVGGTDFMVLSVDMNGTLVDVAQFGSVVSDYLLTVDLQAQGPRDIFVGGYSLGSVYAPNAGDHDMVVARFNSSLSLVWGFQAGSTANDILWSVRVPFENDAVYAGGTTLGIFQPGVVPPIDGAYCSFVIKLSLEGEEIWRIQFVDTDKSETATLLVGPQFLAQVRKFRAALSPSSSNDIQIDTLNTTSGEILHSFAFGTIQSFEEPTAAYMDPSQSEIAYVAGFTPGPLNGPAAGSQDAFIVKYNITSAALLWQYQFGTSFADWTGRQLAVDRFDNVYVPARTQGDLFARSTGGLDGIAMKISATFVTAMNVSTTLAASPGPTSVTILADLTLGVRRSTYYRLCILAVPTAALVNSPQAPSWTDVTEDGHAASKQQWQGMVHMCSDWSTKSSQSNIEFVLSALRVNTAYSAFFATTASQQHMAIFDSLFTTARGILEYVAEPTVATPNIPLTVALSVRVVGSRPLELRLCAPSPEFDPRCTGWVAIPVNPDGSSLTSVIQFGAIPITHDVSSAITVGSHRIAVDVDARGDGLDDVTLPFHQPLPWRFDVRIEVFSEFFIERLGDSHIATVNFSSAAIDPLVQWSIFPPAASEVFISLSTIGGAPPLPFFFDVAGEEPDFPLVFGRSSDTFSQSWVVTADAYPTILLGQFLFAGDEADRYEFSASVEGILQIRIRSNIRCEGLIADSMTPIIGPIAVYTGTSTSLFPELALRCRSDLRFVTSETTVFIGVSVQAPLSVSPTASLELGSGAQERSFALTAASEGTYAVSFSVSVASFLLDTSFFPVNEHGYTLSVQSFARKSRSVFVPNRINITGTEWSQPLQIVLSDAPFYQLRISLQSLNSSLEFDPPELVWTPSSSPPTTASFRCRIKQSLDINNRLVKVGVHIINYTLAGSDEPGYQLSRPSTSAFVYGQLVLQPSINTLYANLAAPVVKAVVTASPSVSNSSIVFTLTASELEDPSAGNGTLVMQPRRFEFLYDEVRGLDLSTLQFTGTITNTTTMSIVVDVEAGSLSEWYRPSQWHIQLQPQLLLFFLPEGFALSAAPSSFSTSLLLSAESTATPTTITFSAAVAALENVIVVYGIESEDPITDWVQCNSSFVAQSMVVYRSLPVYTVTCQVLPGSGAGYQAALVVGEVTRNTLSISVATFSFPPPRVSAGTLRKTLFGLGDTSVFASSVSARDIVYFDGFNFGTEIAHVRVSFGPPEDPDRYVCQLVYHTDNTIGCQMIDGRGVGLVFRLTVRNQATVGTDVFSFPNPPVITQITGCNSAGSRRVDGCPTMGATRLTIEGQFFSSQVTAMTATVGGAACEIESIELIANSSADSSRLVCVLPPGTGAERAVQVSRIFGDVTIASESRGGAGMGENAAVVVSYAAPEISNLFSANCTSGSPNEIVSCPRGNSASNQLMLLLVDGYHFGSENSSAIVIVGSTACISPRIAVLDASRDKQRITCQMQSGEGVRQPLLIVTANGGTNQESPAFVSFEQCEAGTYENTTSGECVECLRYEFQQSPGKPVCDACPTNQYKSSADRTRAICALCPAGALCSQRLPAIAREGYWLAPLSTGTVQPYRCKLSGNGGSGRCLSAYQCFPTEQSMADTALAAVSCCASGRVQAVSNVMCGECLPGYSEWSGTCIECTETDAGLVISYLIVGYVILFVVYYVTSTTSGAQLKILVMFTQTLHAFLSTDPDFPSIFGAATSLDPLQSSTACVTPVSPLGQAVLPLIELLIMIGLLGSLVVFNTIAWVIHRIMFLRSTPSAQYFPRFKKSAFRRVALALATMSIIPVLKTTVQLAKCVDVELTDGSTVSVVEQFPAVLCASSSYKLANGFSIAVSCVLVASMSAFVLLVGQFRYRHYATYLDEQNQARASAMVSAPRDSAWSRATTGIVAKDDYSHRLKKFVELQYGFLFLSYRAHRYTAAWEVVAVARSVCFVLASTLIDDWQSRFSVLVILTVVFLLLHITVQPYHRSAHDNTMETIALLIMFTIAAINTGEWYDRGGTKLVTILLYYGFVAAWVGLLVYNISKHGRCYRRIRQVRTRLGSPSNTASKSASAATDLQRQRTMPSSLPRAQQVHTAGAGVGADDEQGRRDSMDDDEWECWQLLFCWYLSPMRKYRRAANGLPHHSTSTMDLQVPADSSPNTSPRRMSSQVQLWQSHTIAAQSSSSSCDSQRVICGSVEMGEISEMSEIDIHSQSDHYDSRSGSTVRSSSESVVAASLAMPSVDEDIHDEEPLPPGWQEFQTDDEQIPYYVHQHSGVSVWVRPSLSDSPSSA
jgi:WW domain/IPT/TIG domain